MQVEHRSYVKQFIPSANNKKVTYVTLWSPLLNNSTIGKILIIDQNVAHIQHYIMMIDDQFCTILDPCFGCPLNDTSTRSNRKMLWRNSLCCFKNPSHLCSEISIKAENNFSCLCSLSPLMLHELALNSLNPSNNFSIIPYSFEHSQSIFIFDNASMTQLTNLALNFTNASSLTFYTDGSLKNLGLSTVQMRLAWLQTDPLWPLISFHCSFSLHNPSSTLAELLAIIATLLVVPSNSHIQIFTDSSSVISTFDKIQFFLSTPSSHNPIYKIHHYPLWLYLLKLISTQQITLQMKKVKAHSDDQFNDMVDRLAKSDGPQLSFNLNALKTITIPYFHGKLILLPIRQFTKDLLQSK